MPQPILDLARDPDERDRQTSSLELLFDLVTVVALAAAALAWHGAIGAGAALQTLPMLIFVFASIWWPWNTFTWFASAFDNDDPAHRGLTLILLAGYLIFAAGIAPLIETGAITWALTGWIVMRLGMVALWLRVAWAEPGWRRTALRHAIGTAFTLILWIFVYLAIDLGAPDVLLAAGLVFLVEFAIPLWSEGARPSPWNRAHLAARYGTLTSVVLAAVLVALVLSGVSGAPVATLTGLLPFAAGLVTVLALWWIAFADPAEAPAHGAPSALWGHAHVGIVLAGLILAAALGALLTGPADPETATLLERMIAIAAAIVLLAQWVMRDLFLDLGWRRAVLPAGALALAVAAGLAQPAWVTAAILLVALGLRLRWFGGRPTAA